MYIVVFFFFLSNFGSLSLGPLNESGRNSLRTVGGAFASLNSGVAAYKVFELQQII